MQVLFTLFAYWLIVFMVSKIFIKKAKDKDDYLGAGKNFSWRTSSIAIAAMWIWAPALFVSASQGYMNGWVGLFWFIVPNILTLVIFIPFATRLQQLYPEGYSLVGWINHRYSNRVKNLYLFAMATVTILGSAVQIVAGSSMVAMFSDIPYWLCVVLIGVLIFSYTHGKGLRIAVLTGFGKGLILIIGSVVFALLVLYYSGFESLTSGLVGMNNVEHFFTEQGWIVFFSFGLSTSIGLISGTFGDQNFWQISQASKRGDINKAFLFGAVMFAIVPISLGSIGLMASGSGFVPENSQYVNLEYIMELMPGWIIIPFSFMVFAGLLSTLDSNTASISALVNEVTKRDYAVYISPLILIIGAVGVALIPGAFITRLFLIYGVLRATTTMITMLSLRSKLNLNERGVFYGILASMTIGVPVFLVGNIGGMPIVQSVGSVLALMLSAIVAIVWTKLIDRRSLRGS